MLLLHRARASSAYKARSHVSDFPWALPGICIARPGPRKCSPLTGMFTMGNRKAPGQKIGDCGYEFSRCFLTANGAHTAGRGAILGARARAPDLCHAHLARAGVWPGRTPHEPAAGIAARTPACQSGDGTTTLARDRAPCAGLKPGSTIAIGALPNYRLTKAWPCVL